MEKGIEKAIDRFQDRPWNNEEKSCEELTDACETELAKFRRDRQGLRDIERDTDAYRDLIDRLAPDLK